MKNKFSIAMTLAVVLAMVLTSLALADGTPTITSDLPDYAPGATVNLFGAGWQAGESVHIFVNDSVGSSWSLNSNPDPVADDNGDFTYQFQLPNWFVATYSVTATGATAGMIATTTFTDTAPPSSSVTFPVHNTYYNDAGWDVGCASAGACGTATGGKGTANADLDLTGIKVSIQKGTGVSARCWGGSSFNQTTCPFFVAGTLSGSGHGPLNWSFAFGHVNFPEENQYKIIPQAVDTSGSETGNAGKTFFIDRTAPSASITCNAAACSGSYSGSVTVGLSASDPTLGSTGLAGSGVQMIKYTTDGSDPTSSGAATTMSGSSGSFSISTTKTVKWVAYDNAGNVGSVQSQTITITPADSTPPVITIATDSSDTLAGSGWYNFASSGTDGVKVNVSASDPSGVSNITCTDNGTTTVLNVSASSGSFTLGNGTHNISCTATDGASNTGAGTGSTTMPVTYPIDQTAPTVSASIAPDAASTGWYNLVTGAPTVSYNCTDSGPSGVASCPAAVTLGEGANQSVAAVTIFDVAGNESAPSASFSGINVDLTKPTLNITVADGTVCSLPTPSFNPTDNLSEIASSSAFVTPPGTASGVGTYIYTATATDGAGNTSTDSKTYKVTYGGAFSGYLQPINTDGSSRFKLGSTIPVKFQLMCGTTPIANAVAKLYVSKVDGTPDAGVDEAVSTAASTTGNLFRYDSTSQQYIFNLNTKAGYVYTNPDNTTVTLGIGTWYLKIKLDDGSWQVVKIQLPK